MDTRKVLAIVSPGAWIPGSDTEPAESMETRAVTLPSDEESNRGIRTRANLLGIPMVTAEEWLGGMVRGVPQVVRLSFAPYLPLMPGNPWGTMTDMRDRLTSLAGADRMARTARTLFSAWDAGRCPARLDGHSLFMALRGMEEAIRLLESGTAELTPKATVAPLRASRGLMGELEAAEAWEDAEARFRRAYYRSGLRRRVASKDIRAVQRAIAEIM
jgi:hypothetical protein